MLLLFLELINSDHNVQGAKCSRGESPANTYIKLQNTFSFEFLLCLTQSRSSTLQELRFWSSSGHILSPNGCLGFEKIGQKKSIPCKSSHLGVVTWPFPRKVPPCSCGGCPSYTPLKWMAFLWKAQVCSEEEFGKPKTWIKTKTKEQHKKADKALHTLLSFSLSFELPFLVDFTTPQPDIELKKWTFPFLLFFFSRSPHVKKILH